MADLHDKEKMMAVHSFMRRTSGRNNRSILASITLALSISAGAIPAFHAEIAYAQVSGEALFGQRKANPDAQMLLEADELIYDDANNSVAASGNVQIAYDDYTLVAERVTYDRGTGRVIASGNVEIVEPTGNRIFAQELDITDNFQDGFVSALRVESTDNTRFAAESAERRNGELAVFNNGVYTACEPCRDHPEKPPLWQIRAKRVIVNSTAKTVSYEDATFEIFGQPIAYMARFSHADPSIKRKSGFLLDRPGYSSKLGYYGGTSYFWNLAPNYDITTTGRYYSRQGFYGEAEWRHKTRLGEYNFKFAGIDQRTPSAFDDNEIGRNVTKRGAFASQGKFDLNSRWKFGWNTLLQTDSNFARTYSIAGFDSREITNEVYLKGVNGKNYFDLRAQKFLIQDADRDQLIAVNPELFSKNELRQEQQAVVLPSWDYNLVSEDLVAGGQISIDANVTSISRSKVDIVNYSNLDADVGTPSLLPSERHHGIAGNYTRASVEGEWKASNILDGGVLVTTSLSGRGDAIFLDTDRLNTEYNPLTSNEDLYRGMPAAMLEIRYPLVATTGLTSHIFEPIAQIIARPNETHIGQFPNEDAQSFVFDTTNLFERDKFSGFDRVEGGTRANVGFRYSASMQGGASLDFVAGQSFHLAGQNSFAQRDLVNAGLDSGLETKKSDYVASVNLNTGTGFSTGLSGRFDEKTAVIKRGEAGIRYVDQTMALSTSYIYTDKQPLYGFSEKRHEVKSSASVKVTDRVRLFGNLSFDIENEQMFARGVGVAYDDSCFSLSVAYNEVDDRYTGASVNQSILFKLSFRTLGESEYKYNLNDSSQF